MAELPISAEQYFKDLSFDLVNYSILRDGQPIGSAMGLSNHDNGGNYVGFLFSGCDVREFDRLISSSGEFAVRCVGIDTFNGLPAQIKAYY